MGVNAPKKVAVLGLDGVPFGLLRNLLDQGLMPHLQRIVRNGTFLQMETALPAVSSVAWTSFMTGRGPGHHGIFGFTDLKAGQVALRLPSFDDIRCPTIWHGLPHIRSAVVNVPFTYPARPLNGVLISGFVAPLFERSVYPGSLMPWLKSRNYRIDVDAVRGRTDRRLFMQDLFETLAVHTDVMLSLAEDLPWDLFIGVITGTDRLHHFFFDAAEDPDHPFYADFMNYYSQVDSFFAKFLRPAGADTRLIVLSDHGFTRLKIQVYVNRILRNLGYLSFIRPDPQSLEEMHPQSKAFALDPNRIYLNSRDRFRDGVLDSAQKFEVRAKLKRELETMTLYDVGVIAPDGEDRPEDSLFLEVRTADEVYDGDCLSLAPDLVLIQRPGYDLKGAINVPVAARKDIFTGTHTRDDAFLIVGDGVALNGSSKAGITDVAGLIREILA